MQNEEVTVGYLRKWKQFAARTLKKQHCITQGRDSLEKPAPLFFLPAHILKACGEIIRKCDAAILHQRWEPDARVHAKRRENQKTDRENEALSTE